MILNMFEANIIKWYPFKEDKAILQIGINESITKELKKICKKIDVISKPEEIGNNTKYYYVLIYGCENYENIIEKAKKVLDEEGSLLLVGNNDLGINNWSKYSGIDELENHTKKVNTIFKIKEELENNFLEETNTFYVFPNYKLPEIIINKNLKIEKSYLEKYCPTIEENDIKIFDESKVLKNIVSNNPEMMEFFANSYFIEASKKQIETNIKLVSYNNCRNSEYRLITIISDDIVKKIPAEPEAQKQIDNMKNIINDIKQYSIDILDYEKDGLIYSKLIKNAKTLDQILGENYNNLDYVVKILNDIKEKLLNCEVYEENNLHIMKKAFWDMVPKNCFYIDNKYIFFDQEWETENLPVEFIIYRSITNSYDLVRKINVDELLEKLGILQYKKDFEKIDAELRKPIINEDLYQEIYCKEIKAIDNLINDKRIAEEVIKQVQEDNNKKQEYIIALETDNLKKQEYIKALEEKNEQYEKKLERKRFFGKE